MSIAFTYSTNFTRSLPFFFKNQILRCTEFIMPCLLSEVKTKNKINDNQYTYFEGNTQNLVFLDLYLCVGEQESTCNFLDAQQLGS